ncbi:MAG: hypothetical protein CSB34_07100 [Desulfobulbus propionicus]|nr:MAG: hypothetical protein CSB34_07100 [Desulfobulbus propionicus]
MQIATTHKNTDFDALASILAATLVYPDCVAVCPKHVNPNVKRFLALHKTAFTLVLPNEINLDEVDSLIVADTNQWSRLDRMDGLRDRLDLDIILWDHHMGIGDINPQWQRVEKIGATITLFIQEIQERELELTPLLATVFLLGLYEDTGQLTFNSTTPADARAAAFLLEQGADLDIAVEFLNMAYGETQKKVLFSLIRDAEELDIKGHHVYIGVVWVEKYTELAMVVQLYRKIVNAEAVFVIFVNTDGSMFIIGRSGVADINVNKVLAPFGGGGHPGAGSAMLRDVDFPPGQLRQQIITTLKEDRAGHALVADMMSFPVTTITPDTLMHQVRSIMAQKKIRGIVVADELGMHGIIVLWDLKKLKQEKQWQSPVVAFMSREVVTIAPDAQASEAAELMVEKGIGHLPVQQGKNIIGIVTRTDVINYLYGMLPD